MPLSDKQKKFIKDDLADYELRQLLGSAEIVKLFDKKDMGNLCSLMRDSIYLHARNLYNFFHGIARNDASVYEFTNHVFNVSLYIKWKTPLHNHVLHIKDSRVNPNNVIDGIHINAVALDFASDIEKLWRNWIEITTDGELKKLLEDGLEKAKTDVDKDFENSAPRITEKQK